MTLFVAGLPADYDEDDLCDMFGLYGEVNSARIVKDRISGKSKCFGFVIMKNAEDARSTIKTLNGAMMKSGKALVVKEADQETRPSDNDRFAERNFRRRNDT